MDSELVARGRLLRAHGHVVLRFLRGLLGDPPHVVLERHVQEMLVTPFDEVPPGVPERAAVLRQAHSVMRRFTKGRTDHEAIEWARRTLQFWGRDPELREELLCNLARAELTRCERCAVMLHELGTTATERAYVLEQEFYIPAAEVDAVVELALRQYEIKKWAIKQVAKLEHHTLDLAQSTETREARDPIKVIAHAVAASPPPKAGSDEPSPLHQRMVALVETLSQDPELSVDPEFMSIDHYKAYAMLDFLLKKHGLTWVGPRQGVRQDRLIMLTYNSADEDAVRRLHRSMTKAHESRPCRIWVDWLGIEKGKDPFLLVATVILLLAEGYVVSLSHHGLGRMQRWELQTAEHLCAADPGRRRLAIAYLQTPKNGTYADPKLEVPHVRIDLQRRPRRGLRQLVRYLVA
ncbi:MAG: hypothetical protein KDK70_00525 [Myxococcales bacterium]|nr:hypothetical protein [Myxococcales bacterium]